MSSTGHRVDGSVPTSSCPNVKVSLGKTLNPGLLHQPLGMHKPSAFLIVSVEGRAASGRASGVKSLFRIKQLDHKLDLHAGNILYKPGLYDSV